jgi:ankyrin repeat protein
MCSSSGPLTVLLEKGATVFDINGQKQTPLHFAAKHARAANV